MFSNELFPFVRSLLGGLSQVSVNLLVVSFLEVVVQLVHLHERVIGEVDMEAVGAGNVLIDGQEVVAGSGKRLHRVS